MFVQSPINDIVFTGSLPMLVSCDDASNLTMWTTNRSRYFGFIVFEFQNTSIPCNDVGAELVSVISLCYDAAQDVLFTGDADGTVSTLPLITAFIHSVFQTAALLIILKCNHTIIILPHYTNRND